VERLVAIPDAFVPPEFIIQRREFFKQLVWINEQEGEPLTAPPQVSKATVDLFKLYHAVMKRGGFEKVGMLLLNESLICA
jgi:hypothetical protein